MFLKVRSCLRKPQTVTVGICTFAFIRKCCGDLVWAFRGIYVVHVTSYTFTFQCNTNRHSFTGAFSLRFINFYYNSSFLELLGSLLYFFSTRYVIFTEALRLLISFHITCTCFGKNSRYWVTLLNL